MPDQVSPPACASTIRSRTRPFAYRTRDFGPQCSHGAVYNSTSTISPSRRGRRGGEVQAETVCSRPRRCTAAPGGRRRTPRSRIRRTAENDRLSAPRFGEVRALLGTARPRRCLTAAAVRGWAGTLRCRGTPATAGAAGGAGRTRSHDAARPWVRQCARRLLQWGQSLTARPARRGARRAPRPRPARPGRRRPRRTPRGRTTRRRAAPTPTRRRSTTQTPANALPASLVRFAKGVLHRHFVDFDAFLAELVLDRIARLDTQAAARFCWPPEPPPAP